MAKQNPPLTPSSILRAKPGEAVRRISDAVPRLHLVIQPSGTKALVSRLVVNGKKTDQTLARITSNDPKAVADILRQAREEHQKRLALTQEGKNPYRERQRPQVQPAAELTVREVFEAWFQHYRQVPSPKTRRLPTEKTVSQNRHRWDAYLAQDLADVPVQDVTRPMLVKILQRAATKAREESRQALSITQRMFQFAVDHGHRPDNPASSITTATIGTSLCQPRTRTLELPELVELWERVGKSKMDPSVASAIRMLILTAARRSEVAGMRWDEIDGDTWNIPAARMKSRQAHSFHLGGLAQGILDEMRPLTLHTGYVFAGRTGGAVPGDSISQAVRRFAKQHGIEDFCTHDLRRSAATRMGKLGILPHVIDRVLAHAPTNKLVATYQRHDYKEEIRAALKLWDKQFGDALLLAV